MKMMKHPLFKKHPVQLLSVSLAGVGFLPASGTWGSLVAVLIAPFLVFCPLLIWGAVVLSFILGVWAIPSLIKDQKDKDPGFVVIDELAGQLLVFAFSPYDMLNPIMYLFGFLFFRLFDILKPWPVSFFDKKVHNAWGIMMDDIVAGMYAALALALMTWFSF
jgi:phosphatidylglycerophosphatase A